MHGDSLTHSLTHSLSLSLSLSVKVQNTLDMDLGKKKENKNYGYMLSFFLSTTLTYKPQGNIIATNGKTHLGVNVI